MNPGWKMGALALVVGASAGAAWWITSIKYDADIAELKRQHAGALKAVSDKATADSEAARQREHSFQQQIAVLDARHTEEQENAKREAALLRVDIVSAALATCEQSAGAVRRAGSLGDAAAVKLSAAAGQNILDIRTGINEDQAKLVYLQKYVRALQDQGVVAK